MSEAKLLLDTNIVIDYLAAREFDYEKTRLLMIAGKLGEFSLWISSSQVTDIVYIMSEGGKPSYLPEVLEKLRLLCTFVRVYSPGPDCINAMLSTSWADPEDALLYEIARVMQANAIITRNAKDFESDGILVCNSSEFFSWLEKEKGLIYEEIDFL